MALHVFVLLLVACLLLCLARLGRLDWLSPRPSSKGATKRTTVQRLLQPRSPDDCPACRLSSATSSGGGSATAPVRPWREVKSRRGAPKRVNTEGFACANPQCTYCAITDAQVHALVGDGKHGQGERIQTFRCQACRTSFTSRRHTPLYRLKTPSHQIAMVLSALAEGLDASAAERVFGYRQTTITTWLSRAGEHAHTLHEHFFCHLHLPHLYAVLPLTVVDNSDNSPTRLSARWTRPYLCICAERIQRFRCQACHITFSARRDTPLYRLKPPSRQVAVVLSALAEGLDPSAASRVFGSRQVTITTWLTRAGEHAQRLHEHSFCHLWLAHLQLDELRTRLRSSQQVQWL